MPKALKRCVILGGGAHARVVIEALSLSKAAKPCAILDNRKALWGSKVDGVPVQGGDEKFEKFIRGEYFTVGVGDGPRRRLYLHGLAAKLRPLNVIHPRAIVSRGCHLGEGIQIFAGAILQVHASVGDNVIINTGAIVEHDCIIEDHAHISIGARLAGGVRVDEGAFLGAGCIILPGLRIGKNAVVGAGAVVTKDVPAGNTAVGIPARFSAHA